MPVLFGIPVLININKKGLLDNCQKRFLKYLVWRQPGDYPTQGSQCVHLCDKFSLNTLYARRRYISIMFIIKVIRGHIDCPYLLSKIDFAVPQQNTRSTNYIYIPTTCTPQIYNSRIYVLCKLLNDFLCCYNKQIDMFADSLHLISRYAHEYVSLYN